MRKSGQREGHLSYIVHDKMPNFLKTVTLSKFEIFYYTGSPSKTSKLAITLR